VAISGVLAKYSAAVSLSDDLSKRFAFSGKQNFITGFDYQVRFSRSYWFGEISRSQNSGIAWMSGISVNPDQKVTISLVLRDYHPDYHNLYSNAFGQQSQNANEQGIYLGLNASVHKNMTISGYVDCFRFPWVKYRVHGPSEGTESGALLNCTLAKSVFLSFRYMHKKTQINDPTISSQNLHKLINPASQSYQVGLTWSPDPRFTFKSRFDVKRVFNGSGNAIYGYSVFHDFHLTTDRWLSSLVIRFGLFDIPAYEARIYVYEPEVLYAFSVPSYQGKGIRFCGVIKLRPFRDLHIWLRSGLTWYSDREVVGSGMDMTIGKIRVEATVQAMFRL
jgi:hypothetical protein